MIGLLPFMAPVYAVLIVVCMYFGIKIYVGKKRQLIQNEVGVEGLCMECGSKVVNKRCLQCDENDQN